MPILPNNTVQPVMSEMTTIKSIKNYSLQGLFIILETNGTLEHVWLEPKQVIRVPEGRITQQVKNLHSRRLVQISN